MIKYLSSFFVEFDFSSTERVSLAIAYEKINMQREARLRLKNIIDGYSREMTYVSLETYSEIERIAELSGTNTKTVTLLTLILLSQKLRERLAGLGMTKKNIFLTLSDIKYKMRECEMTQGVVGTDKWQWYVKFLLPNLFALGRLQFEISTFQDKYYERDGKSVKLGDPILKVHVPMSGEPLEPTQVSSSYREAKKFFTRLLGIADVPFTCMSWLLAPYNREMLGEKSNIVKFAAKYDLIRTVNFENSGVAFPWIFGAPQDTPIENLPRDTTLRRGYAAILDRGEVFLSGTGIFFLEEPKPKAPKAPLTGAPEDIAKGGTMPQ